MKYFYTIIATVLISSLSYAQSINAYKVPSKIGEAAKAEKTIQINGVSPATAIFILKLSDETFLEQLHYSDSIKEEYGIKTINGVDYINAFISVDKSIDFIEYGLIQNTNRKVPTVLIPVDKLLAIAQNESINYLEIGNKTEQYLDKSLIDTRVKEVHQGAGNLPQAYHGEGVIVGIIDNGFDYTHPTFFDSSYTTSRIKRVWEQGASTGNPPSGFSYGRELVTTDSILNIQRDLDNKSHGSHVAGIAAGSGAGTKGEYSGVASKSDIVLVSTTLQMTDVADGIEYIFNYADSVGMPCVINMSLGTQYGPHDGSSTFDLLCESTTGEGKLLVGSAGNNGNDSIYIGKSYHSSDTSMMTFFKFPKGSNKKTNGNGMVDIWGMPNHNFYVAISIFNTNTLTFDDWTPYIPANMSNSYNFILKDSAAIPKECIVKISTEINPLNNKPHITVEIDNRDQDQDFRWVVIELVAHSGETKIWSIANSAYFTTNNFPTPFVGGSSTSTIGPRLCEGADFSIRLPSEDGTLNITKIFERKQ